MQLAHFYASDKHCNGTVCDYTLRSVELRVGIMDNRPKSGTTMFLWAIALVLVLMLCTSLWLLRLMGFCG